LVPRSRLIGVVIAIIVSSPLFRLIGLLAGINGTALWVATPASLDALGLGSLLALSADQPAARRRLTRLGLISVPLALITLGLVLLVDDRLWLSYVVNETVVALALACLVGKAAEGFGGLPGRLLSLRPMQYVGKISYGIYLYHLFVLQAFWKLLGVAGLPLLDKGPVLFLIVTSTTVAMAALSWKFLERPLNSLKRHFAYEPEASSRTRKAS
jgi:peptidoglycan/LPS O-acetylase OafA/YrhL